MKIDFKKSGFAHRQLKREGQIAIFERSKPDGSQLHFEVIRIRPHGAYEISGVKFPAGESYPSSESWGLDGFTYCARSDADAKFAEMVTEGARICR